MRPRAPSPLPAGEGKRAGASAGEGTVLDDKASPENETRDTLTRVASLSPSSSPAASPAGRGGYGSTAAAVCLIAALSFSCSRENAVIPGREDLARHSRAVLPGKTYENREKIRQGMSQAALSAAVGDPSEKLESRGDIVSGHWTYLYADGKIVILLRDGIVTEVVTTFY